MFRRWAEGRMYRRTVQIAVVELRRAARTSNVIEKLRSLELAEQKFKDALWLRPEASGDRFAAGLGEIERSHHRTLVEQALPAAERLLDAAEERPAERDEMLRAAGELFSFLDHYLPEDDRVDALSARFRQLDGTRPPYRPITPLSEIYHRPAGGAGCATLIGGLLMVGIVLYAAVLIRHWGIPGDIP